MNRGLRILAIVVPVLFALLIVFEFANLLAVLRSRVTLILLLGPLLALFLWSTYRVTTAPKPPVDKLTDGGEGRTKGQNGKI